MESCTRAPTRWAVLLPVLLSLLLAEGAMRAAAASSDALGPDAVPPPTALEFHEIVAPADLQHTQAELAALLYLQALDLYTQNKIAAAIPLAAQAAALAPTVPHLYFLAQAQEELGEYDTALQYFQRAFEVAAISVLTDEQAYWLNFQYAELLSRRIIPQRVPGTSEANALKAQAIGYYQRALDADRHSAHNASESLAATSSSRLLRNRFHALNTIGTLLNDLSRFHDAVPFFRQALELDATAVQPLGNLALALTSLGQEEVALRYNEKALELDPNQPLLLHNMGLILLCLDRPHEAIGYWERAHELNPSQPETISAIAGYHYADKGDVQKTREYLQKVQQLALSAFAKDPSDARAITAYNANRLRLADAQLPPVYQSVDEIIEARAKYTAMLQDLLNDPNLMLPDPFATATIGSMGYYAEYQGFNDVGIRSMLAQIYRRGSPVLSFTAPHVLGYRAKRHEFPLATASLPYLSAPRAPSDSDAAVIKHGAQRKIRVGFHSAFMRHHSVGRLTMGLILNLPREVFEVVVIIYEANVRDEVTESVLYSADRVVLLGKSLAGAQQQVAELQLDVLVFTEIGMDLHSYFLAFSRLALRTALFWGHAVTSGIDSVDYFVSSTLFQHDRDGADDSRQQQAKYSECVYAMRHLTTYFTTYFLPLPLAPAPFRQDFIQEHLDRFRASLGLPSKSVLETMFLVPQTLYKLHPDFDALIERILFQLRDTAFLAVLTGAKPWLADAIRVRWRRTLSPSVYKRIYFVRLLNTSEFVDVCAMADVVLDPFPVGGGRSSLEIFSVGTPIVMLASRTTILQLTAAMYKLMGFQDLIAFSEDEYVAIAVQLALDTGLKAYFKRLILANNRRLYAEDEVIREWAQFFVDILAAKSPVERTGVDATARSPASCPQFAAQGSPYNSSRAEPFFEVTLRIQGRTDGDGSSREEFALQLQSPDDDPFETVKALPFMNRVGTEVDWFHQNITAKMLWNAKHRLQQPVVGVFPVTIDLPSDSSSQAASTATTTTLRLDPIEVRYGDDLHLMVRSHLQREFKRHPLHAQIVMQEKIRELIDELKRQLPAQSSPQWIDARSFPLRNRFAVQSESRLLQEHCVTLVITTCKRLTLFLRMIASLKRALGIPGESSGYGWSKWFCRILVIDDNSSQEDRLAMQQHVPSDSFEFYFKTPAQRGHAKSLNIALQFVESRFVMYMEDDWEFQGEDGEGVKFLSDALAILRAHRASLYEPLALVLLNDQRGGWERRLAIEASSSSSSEPRSVKYFVHESAVSDPAHTFSCWPGFSLNPGVWDLHALLAVLGNGSVTASRNAEMPSRRIFEEETDIFEHLLSLRVWKSGLRVAFLAHENFVHIGAPAGSNASAYVLNGMPRRFDNPVPQQGADAAPAT